MTVVSLLIASFVELGLTFPGGGLEQEVNIGKFLEVSYQVVSIRKLCFSSYARLSRYPAITSSFSVNHATVGFSIGSTVKILGLSGTLGIGLGIMKSSENILNCEIYPTLKRAIFSDFPLYFTIGVPLMFFNNITLYAINTGILFSI